MEKGKREMKGKWWKRKGLKKYKEHVMSSGRIAEYTEQTHNMTDTVHTLKLQI